MANFKRGGLVGLVGAVAAGILYTATPAFEGTEPVAYRDPVGIPTACIGHTGPEVVVGTRYTRQQCEDLFDKDMYKHAAGALVCTPQMKDKPYLLAAASDFAFHMGVGAWCNSSMASAVRSGDLRLACIRFNENAAGKPQWVFAKDPKTGKMIELPGLVTRAAWRRSTCLSGL